MNPTTIGPSIANSLVSAGIPSTLSLLGAFAFLLAVEIIVLFVLVKLLQSVTQAILKARFHKQYHIVLSGAVSIRPLPSAANRGTVTLHIPFWRYENKDGSRDKRRQNNQLVTRKSSLTVSHYSIASYEPYAIYWLYKELVLRGTFFETPRVFHGTRCTQIARSSQPAPKPTSQAAAAIYTHYSNHPTDFEEYCADLFRHQGYSAETTSKTNDGGFDIKMVDPQGKRCIVECKCYNPASESVGRDLIQKLVGANAAVQAQRMLFVTTTRFTDAAVEYAESIPTPVELIDGNKLEQILRAAAFGNSADSSTQANSDNQFSNILSWNTVMQYYPPDVTVPADRRCR